MLDVLLLFEVRSRLTSGENLNVVHDSCLHKAAKAWVIEKPSTLVRMNTASCLPLKAKPFPFSI